MLHEGLTGVLFLLLPLAVVAYLLGCFNGAVIVSKYILRDDVRTHGSGNAGLTNFHRTFGGGLTFVVILTDVLKAVIAVLAGILFFRLAGWPGLETLGKFWAGLFCLVGHMFPVFFGFRGGKGILSGGTVAIMLDWRIAVVVWGGFFLFVILTRWVSLGSIWAAVSFPAVTWAVYRDGLLLLIALGIGGLILWKHRANMGRILRGEESRLSFHKKKE